MVTYSEILAWVTIVLSVCAVLASIAILWVIVKERYSLIVDPNSISRQDTAAITRSISADINGVYVQQCLANIISVFRSALALAGQTQSLPEMKSAYPRRLPERPLTDNDLHQSIQAVLQGTATTRSEVEDYIKQHLNQFLRTQRQSTVFGSEKVEIRKVFRELEEKYEQLYEFRPLHEADLKSIFAGEGLRTIQIKGLPVLAALVQYVDTDNTRKEAVLIKDDPSVPQALKEFAMAHELGHWFAHIKPELSKNAENVDFYLHSFHDVGPFEKEANKIGMLILFPTPYLSWCDLYGKLTAEMVLAKYNEGIPEEPDRPRKNGMLSNMQEFVQLRIEGYKNYRRIWLEHLRLPDMPFTERTVPFLIEDLFKDFRWARLDSDYFITDANDRFADLIGLTLDELLGEKRSILEVTHPSVRDTTLQQLEKKRNEVVPKFYIAKYVNLRTQKVIPVTVYAFPIIDQDKKYVGSFGIVTDIREGIAIHSME
jgi:PAS domain S-box-containing protein